MRKKAFLTLGIILIILQSAALAADCPNIVSLGSISLGFSPTRVAVDGQGNLYATYFLGDRLYVYNYKGDQVKSLSLTRPAAVTTDPSGNVYATATSRYRASFSGKVSVYDSGLNYMYDVGVGMGEFYLPIDMAADSERLYVADRQEHVVSVWDLATGAFLYELGGNGLEDGKLNLPGAVGLSSAGDIYVGDSAYFYDSGSGDYGWGASGHIWKRNEDGSYTFLTRFGTYSNSGDLGTLGNPSGLALDSQDRVYIADYNTGKVQIFDASGAAICTFSPFGSANARPSGVVIGKDKRMLLGVAGAVYIYGIDDYVKLAVSPSSLEFDAQACGSRPPDQTITVSNEGPGVLEWTLTSSAEWLSASSTSGSLNGVASQNVSISVDPSGLSSGTHTATITVSAAGAKIDVPVTVTVAAAPALSITPASFSFEVRGRDVPPSEAMYVDLTGDVSGTLMWDASADSPWIAVSPSSGPSNTQTMAAVSVNSAALEAMEGGQYTGKITVSAGCSTGSPAEATVSLTYIKGGTIRVTTNVEAATFALAGPESYTGSGTSFVVDGAPEGNYTITYGGIAGFIAPASATLAVANGGETEFVGNYKDLRENNSIIATMGVGEWYVADEVAVFDGSGASQGSFVVATSAASRTDVKEGMATAAADIDGDGVEEIIAAHDKGIISAYRLDGTAVQWADYSAGFRAFEYASAVELATGDLDGDGTKELIVSSGIGSGDYAEVRVFGLAGGAISDTGIYFIAYAKRSGVNVAASDVDGDGAAEIITAPGGTAKTSVNVRIFRVDASAGAGAWTVAEAGSISVGTSYATDVAAGDLDADGVAEIIVSTLPRPSDKLATVSAYRASDLAKVLGFTVSSSERGVSIAAGDTDMDGRAEIVVGEGAQSKNGTTVRVYGPDGVQKGEFRAFDGTDIHGVRVSLGRLVE